MCHNSGIQSEQIERFVQNGMPQKIVKTVKYTLMKRAAEQRKKEYVECVAAAVNITASSSCDQLLVECDKEISINDEINNSANINALTTTTSTITATTAAVAVVETEKDIQIENKKIENTLKIPKMCGRFRQMKNAKVTKDKEISKENSSSSSRKANEEYQMDILAVSTALTKKYIERLSGQILELQHSKIYTLVTKTTQPAHAIAIGILSFVLLMVGPDVIENNNNTTDASNVMNAAEKRNNLAVILYLGAFATHFGAQIWMTFISGLSLYFSLPRHTFGQCQKILFPKYFALSSGLSISMLILYAKYFLNGWSISSSVQLTAITITATIEVIIRLYLAPPLLSLMHEKYKLEDTVGSGREVGTLEQGDLILCPHYQRVHKSFRRVHMTVAMGNLTILLATCLHLYCIALKVQLS